MNACHAYVCMHAMYEYLHVYIYVWHAIYEYSMHVCVYACDVYNACHACICMHAMYEYLHVYIHVYGMRCMNACMYACDVCMHVCIYACDV